jgi:hypothetical protein
MKQFIIPVFASVALLSVVACNGSSGGSTPAPIPQIVLNGTYKGNIPGTTPPASLVMVVSGLSAALTVSRGADSGIINGAFNANVATSSSSVTSAACYNGAFADGTAITMTNCLYLEATSTFSGNMVYSQAPQTPVPIILVAS